MKPLYFQLPLSWHESNSKLVYVERCQLKWANQWAERLHYKHKKVHDLACPFAYSIHSSETGEVVGVVILATPHFTKLRSLFGYPQLGLPTQWQVLLVSRVWIEPAFQQQTIYDSRGREHSLCIASCAIAQILKRVNEDWLEHHPPPFPEQPYNLRLLISYADLEQKHEGVIYQASNFTFSDLSYSNKVSRHSKEKREFALPLLRYFIPLRHVYDPLKNRKIRWCLPKEWAVLHNESKQRLRAALEKAYRVEQKDTKPH
jgi:hypothetical protein